VKKLAEKLNYSPNPIAQSLKKNKTTTIGVIVPEIKHDFFSSAISGIEDVAYQSGYTIILSQSNENFEREVINTNALVNHRVAGIIVSISQQTKNGDHFKILTDRNIPIVFFDRVCEDIDTNKIIIDDEKGALNAVEHLIEKGYKKIAHIAGPQELDICKKRLNGYSSALRAAGFSPEHEMIIYGGMQEVDGYNCIENLLTNKNVPDAVFCINDPVAIGAYQRIVQAGLRIPDDIGIVGFSNNKITTLVNPQLTTVEQPSYEMGRKAAEILIGMIENTVKNNQFETIVLNSSLIVRGST
jgi:DNA-binding LacI/PurR family transcriptional regulator